MVPNQRGYEAIAVAEEAESSWARGDAREAQFAPPGPLLARLRTLTFVASAVAGVVGIGAWACLVAAEARAALLPRALRSLGCYALGFGAYATRVPERWWPGGFDLALHSHQLWHACVVAAVLVWYSLCIETTNALRADGCAAFERVAPAPV